MPPLIDDHESRTTVTEPRHDEGMGSLQEIEALLDELETLTADDLEDQYLDFKRWGTRSRGDAIQTVIDAAVCMANGGGGTVVLGVADQVAGRSNAIVGVPPDVEIHRLQRAVYDSTDPKLTPVFNELRTPEGTGRLLVMEVHPGMRPYTDTKGRGSIRIGKDCQPLTGTVRRKISTETGESDFTGLQVNGELSSLTSPAALEELRAISRKEQAPNDLLSGSDDELLAGLDLVRAGQLTHAGLLLAGATDALRERIPTWGWTYLRMRPSGTNYTDRLDGREALPVALGRLTSRILAENPIKTVHRGLFHYEYRTYPEVALREVLMNAFAHADYRLGSPILVKQFDDRIEISNPGGFIGGITPENILHHAPISRNPCLVDALVRLRLVNRSNLGIQRIFHALLVEGKEPPVIEDSGETIRVTIRSSDLSVPFRSFIAREEEEGKEFSVDHLLILQYLRRHPEIDTATAARICQRPESSAREILAAMERHFGYLERGGAARGTYWFLRREYYDDLVAGGDADRDRRVDWEAAKTRVLSTLRRLAEEGEPGLSNADVRRIAGLTRNQAFRLMRELRDEHPGISSPGLGRNARYVYEHNGAENADTH